MSVGTSFAHTVSDGSLLVATPVAVAAGLVSFLSPCVLPLVPGYLSYVTGLSGADLESVRRGRLVAGAGLFVLGFSAVFVSTGALFGDLGARLADHQAVITRVLGGLTIVLGLAFLGLIPALSRDLRVHRLPATGLVGAPLLGVLFGVGWAPCLGPTLAAVQSLAFTQASAARGAFLTFAYCVGLGLPFLVVGVALRRALAAFAGVRRPYRIVMGVGGLMLISLGVLLITGAWDSVSVWMRHHIQGYTTAI